MKLSSSGFYAELIGNLVFYRKESGLSQADIAREIGCLRTVVANIETLRSRITPEQIDAWCKSCKTSVVSVWPTHPAAGETP